MSDSIEFIVGGVRSSLEALEKSLENHRDEGREGRARIYKEIEATNFINKTTQKDVEKIAARLDELDSSMAEIEKWKQQLAGARMAVWAIAAAVGAAIAPFGKWVSVKIGLG